MVLKIAQALRNLHREESGFTLIELLIVVAILAVLAAIAIPMVASRIDEARASANAANIRLLQSAVDLYYLDCSQYPTDFQGDLLTEPTDVDGWSGPYIKEEVEAPTGFGDYLLNGGKVENTP